MRKLFVTAERVFHAIMLLLILGAFLPLWREMSGAVMDPVQGDPVQRGVLLIGYTISLITLLFYPRTTLRLMLRSLPLWALIVLASLSATWSLFPYVTLRKAAALALGTLYVLALMLRFRLEDLVRLLGWVFWVSIGMSLVLVFFQPDWGVMDYPHEGAWRGVFLHKNALGAASAVALLVFDALLWNFDRNVRTRYLWAGGFALALITLIGSRSATSLVLAVALIGGTLLLRLAKLLRNAWPVFLMLFILLASSGLVLSVQYYELLLETLDKDATLTGRVPLWLALIPMAIDRPWLGYGYGSFWLGLDGPSAAVWSVVGWLPAHGHNGYIDMWLELGVVGLAFGLWTLLTPALRFVSSVIRGNITPEATFLLNIVAFLFIQNFVESTFLRTNNLYWMLLVYAYIYAVTSHYARGSFPPAMGANAMQSSVMRMTSIPKYR